MIEKPRWLPEQIKINNEHYAIFIVWLFQISAIVGVYFGFLNWFISKTPLNLIIQVLLLFWVFPVRKNKQTLLFILLFCLGMIAEIVGVATGFPFGTYRYGANLGPKLLGVPLLIGCNWAVLVFIGGAIANRISSNLWIKAIIGGVFMIALDIPMEILAPTFDFWEFTPAPPIENYISWFVIGALMHIIFHVFKTKGSFAFSLNLLLAQFFFFTVLALYL